MNQELMQTTEVFKATAQGAAGLKVEKAKYENILYSICMFTIIPKPIAYAVIFFFFFFYTDKHVYRKAFIQKVYQFASQTVN